MSVQPWYKRNSFIIVIVLVVIAGIVLLPGSRPSRVEARRGVSNQNETVPPGTPSDSQQADSLNTDQVNGDRLREFVKTENSVNIDTAQLEQQINAIIDQNSDVLLGVAIEDLQTGAVYNYGHTDPYTAASVTKVITAADYMKQVELGHKSLDDIMVDGNTAQYDIERMIVDSNNSAWEVLNEDLTYSQMQDYAESIGLSSYYYGTNVLNAPDATKLLADLYERLLINESHTELLLSYMERANYRDLIIPAVPETDIVYHKAGELYSNLHDATIITDGSRAIVLSVFSESLGSYSKSRVAGIMQQITTPALQTFHLD